MIVNFKALGVWSIAGTDGRIVNIIPGVNEPTDDEWNAIKDHPTVITRIDEGVLVVVQEAAPTGSKKKQPEGLPKTLDSMTVITAIDFIGGVFDIDQLKAWKKKESRNGIVSALEKQIKAVKAADDTDLRE